MICTICQKQVKCAEMIDDLCIPCYEEYDDREEGEMNDIRLEMREDIRRGELV